MNQTATPEANTKTGNGGDSELRSAGMGGGHQGSSTGQQGSSNLGTQQSSGSSFGMQQGRQSEPQKHSEGMIARTIEEQTAKLPSDTFLWAAVGAMVASAIFEFSGAKDKSRFVGQWVAPMLLFGVYNKLIKQQGSDRVH